MEDDSDTLRLLHLGVRAAVDSGADTKALKAAVDALQVSLNRVESKLDAGHRAGFFAWAAEKPGYAVALAAILLLSLAGQLHDLPLLIPALLGGAVHAGS